MKLYQKLAVAIVGVTLSFGVIEASLQHPATAAILKYTITDLGNLGGTGGTTAYGINDLGQVVGVSASDANNAQAFRTEPNQPINPATDNLGTLIPGAPYTYASIALSINNLGQVVGYSQTFGNPLNQNENAFRTAPNQAINPATDGLSTLGGTFSFGNGINNLGQVVGSSLTTNNNYQHAFRTAPNQPINPSDDLGTFDKSNPNPFGNFSEALAINDLGQVVGDSTLPGTTNFQAFRTQPNQPLNLATDQLGTLGRGTRSNATAINNQGQVAGFSFINSGNTIQHAFRTAANSPISPVTDDLGTLGGTNSLAYGINNSGLVVGQSQITGNSIFHAFVYDGNLQDLNSSAVSLGDFSYLDVAYGINNLGQIVGEGVLSSTGKEGAFLATPLSVPESSSTISILSVLGLGLLFKRKVKLS